NYPTFLKYMDDRYPESLWSKHFSMSLHTGTLFRGMDIHAAKAKAKEAAWHLGGTSYWCVEVTKALLAEFNNHLNWALGNLWKFGNLEYSNLDEHIDRIEEAVLDSQPRKATMNSTPSRTNHQE
ncbi:hypothetical protein H4R33_007143, partial [Dimargaris cristalligena]